MSQRYAPGVRVEIRDAEWRIKCIDHTSDGGELLTCEGLSELVRGREATFLTKIEPNIRVLAPEDTVLVDDTSSAYRASRHYADLWSDCWAPVITPSKGLVDVGLPLTARKADLDNSITTSPPL